MFELCRVSKYYSGIPAVLSILYRTIFEVGGQLVVDAPFSTLKNLNQM
jgi:hypothetical protein